jgi:hypothetical protein
VQFAKRPKFQARQLELKKQVREEILPRIEQLKQQLSQPRAAVHHRLKPTAVRVSTANMPLVDWTQYTPTAPTPTSVPPHFFVENRTVERLASQPPGSMAPAPAGDPNDPFAASAAFLTPPETGTAVVSAGKPPQVEAIALPPVPGVHCQRTSCG